MRDQSTTPDCLEQVRVTFRLKAWFETRGEKYSIINADNYGVRLKRPDHYAPVELWTWREIRLLMVKKPELLGARDRKTVERVLAKIKAAAA